MSVKSIKEFQSFHDEHMTKEVIYKEKNSQAFVLNFLPGQKLPSHGHPYAHVYLLVVNGAGTCGLDEETYEIQEGSVIHCSKEQHISIENTGAEKLTVYVVLSREGSPHEQGKA